MKRLVSLAAALLFVMAAAAPAAAGGRTCPSGGDHCPPPKVFEVDAQQIVCGDPRTWTQGINSGNVDSVIEWTFRKGNLDQGGKVVLLKDLPANQTKAWGPRWTRGNGAWVKVRAWNPLEDSWVLLLKYRQNQFGEPWGTAGCPEDRFGEPTWETPRHTTLVTIQ